MELQRIAIKSKQSKFSALIRTSSAETAEFQKATGVGIKLRVGRTNGMTLAIANSSRKHPQAMSLIGRALAQRARDRGDGLQADSKEQARPARVIH